MKNNLQQSDALDNFLTAADEADERKKKSLKPKRFRLTRKMKDELMADLGLTKVRGAVSGRVYYE